MPDPSGADLLGAYFERVRWTTVREGGDAGEPTWFGWAYRGEHGEWYGQTWWLEAIDAAVTYSLCPFVIPAPYAAEVSAYAGRINGMLATSTVEFDDAALELRVRASAALPPELDTELAMELLERSILSCLSTMDRALPGLVQIVGADAPVEAAVERFVELS